MYDPFMLHTEPLHTLDLQQYAGYVHYVIIPMNIHGFTRQFD